MSKIEVNTVEPQCGTTLTLGGSGDTVALGSGASQTGFGRTGTVDWQTSSIKTATFTAVNGKGYFCNTTGGAFNITLPASPTAGDIVALKDYAGTFADNNLTIDRNGSNLDNNAGNRVLSTNNLSMTLVYVDGTQGWKSVEEGTGYIGEVFMVATGGCITTSGDDKIHKFTGPGTFTVCSVAASAANNLVSYIVVAGGASGGSANNNNNGGGGGGAGGFRETKSPATPYTASPLDGYATPGNRITVTAADFPITVGGGGSASSPMNPGSAGSTSTFSTTTSHGGGGGGANSVGLAGGSGGGGSCSANAGGAGNTPPVTPAQGLGGGDGAGSPPSYGGGGGGGATVAGTNGSAPTGGAGGAGATTNIIASPVAYSGGGGGGAYMCGTAAGGGTGGGGAGTNKTGSGTAGTVNTGGGGGGANNPSGTSGAGGSGIVIIRYKYK